jgi:hypothetical protein
MLHYYFPPLVGMGSVRAVKLAAQLPDFGWTPAVVSSRSGPDGSDPSLVPAGGEILRTGQLRLRRPGAASPRPVASAPAATPAAGVRALLHRWVYRPDAQIGWYPFALRAARRVLRDRPVDVLFSSSFPITAHLVARTLHRETGLPWVAEFRDTWSDGSTQDGRRLAADTALERALVREATGVVTVSDTWAELFRARGARRAWTLTNGFDPSDFAGEAPPPEPRVTYVGTYYPHKQDLLTPIAALGTLVREPRFAALGLRLVGEMHPALPPALATHGLSDHVECTGLVPHAACVRHAMTSGVLLVAGPLTDERPELRGNVAGKIFECLATRRPILFVGAPDSDAAKLLRPFPRVRIVPPGDVAGATAALRSMLTQPCPRGGDLEPFTHRALADRLAHILSTAHADRNTAE